MSNYKNQFVSLSELGTVARGKSKHRPRNDPSLYSGKYPFIQTGDVKHSNFYITRYSQTYNEIGLAQSKLWEPGTLCITIAANIADTAILTFSACFPDSIIGFIPDEEKSDVRFIKYCLDTYKLQIQSISQGTTQDNLSLKKLESIKLKAPHLRVQEKIAAVLSAYDDLIENNNRRIALLEKMAEEIYREWFVRLRFPGHEGVAFHKGIPEGWEVEKFSKLLDFKTGKLNSNAALPNGKYPFFTCSNETFKTNTYSFDIEAVLLAGNNAAGVYPLKYFMGKFDAYQRTYVVTPKKEYLSVKFIYFMLNDRLGHLQTISVGAATQFLTLKMLNSLVCLNPDENLVIEFEQTVGPMFKEISLLKLAQENLRRTRDRLLTRLISGKLSVEDLDIQFPPSMTTDT